jgi:uncharacterized protein YdcH (DUF465 family)
MIRIPHDLQEEFPEEAPLIARTTASSYQFRRLAERYDEVNRKIYRIESEEAPTTDEVLERLKKRRLKLKDEIASILAKLEHRM